MSSDQRDKSKFGSRTFAIVLIVVLIALYFRNYLFFENLHPVIEGEIYRSGQPSAEGLEGAVESIGLRSVLNLKGGDPGDVTVDAVGKVAKAAKLDLRFVRLSARRWPSPQEVRRLIENIDTAPRPLLIHCQGGTDRSGLASAVALLLDERDFEEAEAQFALRYGYPGQTMGSDLPGFLALYREWLARNGKDHDATTFRHWVDREYIAYYYEAEIEFDLPREPVEVDAPFTVALRVTNRSEQAIPLRCAEGAGVRLSVRLQVLSPDPRRLRERRFCTADTELAPGEQIEIASDTYRLKTAGTYEFTADLVDELEEHFFADMGSVVTRRTLVAR